MPENFVHCHVHTHASAFDGLGTASDFFKRAAEMGQVALATTEHGTLRGLYEATTAAKETGVKFIPGCEFYLADDALARGLTKEEKAAIEGAAARDGGDPKELAKAAERLRRERDHVTVWALDDEGLGNLIALSSWSWREGFYYKPRVDVARLTSRSRGLAISTGCLGGVVSAPLRVGDVRVAFDRLDRLVAAFPGRVYVELQPHCPPGAEGLAEKLARLARDYDLPVIATQDAHYPRRDDSVAQEALLCVGTRDKIANPDRFRFDSREYWLRSRAEMAEAFAANCPGLSSLVVEKALDETVAFAERCSARLALPGAGAYLAAPALPEGVTTYDAWLLHLCAIGSIARYGKSISDLPTEHLARLRAELTTIKSLGFAAYFAMVYDLRAWARAQGIFVGPGRGSAAGSLVAYLARIVDVDPIRHGLSFDRFLAPGRVDLPDIDLDFEDERRDEVLVYLRERYGEDRVAHISTVGTMRGKSLARDLGRIYGVPDRDVSAVASVLPDATEDVPMIEALASTAIGREFAERYPDVVDVATRLEGQMRGVGLHPAGVVVSRVPVATIAPVETRPRKGGERVAAVAWDMVAVEKAGFVKIDVLGLRALSFLRRACLLAGIADPTTIELEDAEALDAFTAHRFGGIFQFDTPSARKACRGFVFRRFADIAAMTALDRPGPMQTGMVAEFVKRSEDPSLVPAFNPVYDRITAETFGVVVYQEQIVALARELAGFTPEAADKFRKAISKKKREEVDAILPVFVKGCVDVGGMDRGDAEKFAESLEGFAEYCFNKAHAISYAAIALWSMHLKVHYPEAFFAAFLQTEPNAQVQLRVAAEARHLGIPVMPPDVNAAAEGLTLAYSSTGAAQIVNGIAEIKGIGKPTAASIAARAPFKSLVDFYDRTAGDGLRVTVATFELLARATAFRSLFPSVRFLVENAREVWDWLKVGVEPVLDVDYDYDGDTIARIAGEVCPLYVDAKGRSAFTVVERLLREGTRREIATVGEIADAGAYVVLARVSAARLFSEDGGGKTLRVLLSDNEGAEVAAKVDQDVTEATLGVLDDPGRLVLVVLRVSNRGMITVEVGLDANAAITTSSPLADAILRPKRTSPRDPGAALERTPPDASFAAEGVVVRSLKRRDKSGGKLRVVTLAGSAGFARFFVFDRRHRADVKALTVGARVRVKLTRLEGDAACLADAAVEVCATLAPAVS